jgi:type I restriction enzyme S subunit
MVVGNMGEWKEYRLCDVASLTTGFPFDGHKYAKEGIRVVRGDNVTIGNLRWDSDKDKRWAEPFERSTEYTLHAEDIVIGMDGSRVGKNRAQVKKEDLPLLIAQRVACVRHNELSLQKYLYYQIFSDSFEQYIKAVQTGTSIPHVSLKQIGDFPIVLPSISKQKRIAEILSSLDKKIEINRRINDNLEQQAQALFKSWFVDFEPFKDGEFVESELGMIPKGWRVGILNELGDIVGGSTPSKAKAEYYTNDGIAWLTPKDLSISQRKFTSKGEIDITQEGYESCSTKLMPRGSVLFSSRAPIGYITIAKNDICTNQGFKSVIPKLAGTAFLYCFLKESTQEIENKATGSTFKEASGALMKSLPAIIPEKAVLDDFEDLLSPLFYQQEVVEEENSLLSSLRDSLLPRLMSGKLNVSEINM